MTELVNLLDVVTEGRELPDGYDFWAIRSVHPDFMSRNGYRWPLPGKVAKASGPFEADNTDGCPDHDGDGICAALSWYSMSLGGTPASTLLLVAVKESDVLGRESCKFRAKKMKVVDVIDGYRLVRELGRGANLYGANLSRANLSGADLSRANLSGANLYGARNPELATLPAGWVVRN